MMLDVLLITCLYLCVHKSDRDVLICASGIGCAELRNLDRSSQGVPEKKVHYKPSCSHRAEALFSSFQPRNPGNCEKEVGRLVGRGFERKANEWMRLVRHYTSGHRSERIKLLPKNSALLVIDMQRYFLERSSHAYVPSSKAILENIRALIKAYRKLSLPVVFTRYAVPKGEDPGAMGRWWGDVLREEDELSEIVHPIAPSPEEIVLRKSQYSAFVGTDLEKILRKRRVKSVIVTGVLTHLCCETTARDAFMRGFDVFFVIDGTASDREELHVSSLRTLTDGFAIPMTTAEVVKRLKLK